MVKEPTRLNLATMKLLRKLYGKSIYQDFARRLPLTNRDTVLDFGCGIGEVAYYVLERLSQGELTCLDISERLLNSCEKTLRKYSNVTYQNFTNHKLSNEKYDLIYCHFFLQGLSYSNLELVIPALVKALKPGGCLVFREPLKESQKLKFIKELLGQEALTLHTSRITDLPLLGTSLESIYFK